MGQRDNFAYKDVEKINKMYKCNKVDPGPSIDNNVDASVFDSDESPQPTRPNNNNRPTNSSNYPVLNFLGNLVSAAIQSG